MVETWAETARLCHLEQRLLDPEVRRSAAEVAALLDDDFIEFGSSGRVYDKREVIEALQNESTAHPVERSVQDLRVRRLAPDVALVTYRIFRRDASDEDIRNSLRSSVWRLDENGWRMLFHQGTTSH